MVIYQKIVGVMSGLHYGKSFGRLGIGGLRVAGREEGRIFELWILYMSSFVEEGGELVIV